MCCNGNRQIENLHYDPYRISLTVIDMATIGLTALQEWAYNMHHIDIAGAYLMHPLNPLTEQYIYVHHEDLTTTQLHVGSSPSHIRTQAEWFPLEYSFAKHYKRWAARPTNPTDSSATTMVITYLWVL